ncbi:MAG: DegV family protein [Candidatus Aminicenantales bacterium]
MSKAQGARIGYLDGFRLQVAIVEGCREILAHEAELDRINVFPIPDHDTGANLKRSLKPLISSFPRPFLEIQEAALAVARLAVESAFGFSGIIFSQFLQGFAEGLKPRPRLRADSVIPALDMGLNRAFQCLKDPQEGTVLSVLKAFSEEFRKSCFDEKDFLPLLERGLEKAREALRLTPRQLEVLAKNKVVDAGGQAFVYFLGGILRFIHGGTLKDHGLGRKKTAEKIPRRTKAPNLCAECSVHAQGLRRKALLQGLKEEGEDLIFYSSRDFAKIHIRTHDPDRVFSLVSGFGALSRETVFSPAEKAHPRRRAPFCLVGDSSCDLNNASIEHNPVYFVPIKVQAGEHVYTDRLDLIPEEFYPIQESSPVLPKTSQPSRLDFTRIYAHLLEHYETLLSVHLSGKLSGTFATAVQAAESVDARRIRTVDGKNLSVGLGIILMEGIKTLQEGAGIEDILLRIQRAIERTRIFIGLPTLKYLVKGGRITRAKGLFARILNLHPILSLNPQGELVPAEKVWGRKGLEAQIVRIAAKFLEESSGGSYAVAHTHAPETGERIAAKIRALCEKNAEMVRNASPVLGAHAGPGAFGVAVLPGEPPCDSASEGIWNT